ncbi:MAG: glucose-1-phosphate adenylyltransferase subunit GlgD [Eubacteriales bacterium]|nr:glucose-1-phosphate adenylyltransferase subunit GlgD [Eubacteriales bacterium]
MPMIGVVFCGLYNAALDELTRDRTVASLPFGGRYRLIDFTLSNLVNSGINTVGIITTSNYRSLLDHLGSCREWDLDRKNGGLVLLPPFVAGQRGKYRGKLDELGAALTFLERRTEEYVFLTDTATVCQMDLRPILGAHAGTERDVTVLGVPAEKWQSERAELVLETDGRGTVCGMSIDCLPGPGSFAGIGACILSRELLIQAVRDCQARGLHHLERDFLQSGFNRGKLRIAVHEHRDVFFRSTGVAEYFRNNLALLDEKVMHELFRPDMPVFTKVRDEVPSFYGDSARPENCLIADGCEVYGRVERSVLFRAVTVGKGAELTSCVVMQGSRIGEGAVLENVIVDKGVTVFPHVHLRGAEEHPVVLRKGAVISV